MSKEIKTVWDNGYGESIMVQELNDGRVRRHAAKQGYKLTKLREGHRDYAEHGPYMLADARHNSLVVSGLADLAAVWHWLSDEPAF